MFTPRVTRLHRPRRPLDASYDDLNGPASALGAPPSFLMMSLLHDYLSMKLTPNRTHVMMRCYRCPQKKRFGEAGVDLGNTGSCELKSDASPDWIASCRRRLFVFISSTRAGLRSAVGLGDHCLKPRPCPCLCDQPVPSTDSTNCHLSEKSGIGLTSVQRRNYRITTRN